MIVYKYAPTRTFKMTSLGPGAAHRLVGSFNRMGNFDEAILQGPILVVGVWPLYLGSQVRS